jgi:multicomponent Na+:H+ antiporter subunit E
LKTITLSFTSLFLLWLLLSGYFKTNLIVFGIFSCVLVTYLSIRLKIYSSHHERIKFNLRLPFYIPWLLKEIVKSNLHVARCILSSGHNIQPQTVCAKASQKTNIGLAVHANSITLTPATISVDLNENEILVHALTNHAAQGIIDGGIDKRVSKLEGSIN